MSIIKTSKLTKFYGEIKGIENLDLEIEEGEVFGFIGPNGAGKSTTIRTILGLMFPTSGSAEIFGKEVFKHGPEIRKDIGYLPSEVFYYDNMRVKDLLTYSASFYNKDCSKRTAELVEIMGLDVNRKIDDLSYGNKKKVGIVQGLQHSPKLIILDEPTGGLDPLMQNTFFDLLKEEQEKGATIFFSSHILSEVQRLCDRVAIIKEGEIIKVENVKDLLRNNYRKFRLEPKSKVTKVMFEIEGVNNLDIDEEFVSFLFRGDLNKMTKIIAGIDLHSLWVEEPSLEEIFMHYYID